MLINKIKVFEGEYCKTFLIESDKTPFKTPEPSISRSSSQARYKMMSSNILNKDRGLLKNNNDLSVRVRPFEEKRASVKTKAIMPIAKRSLPRLLLLRALANRSNGLLKTCMSVSLY